MAKAARPPMLDPNQSDAELGRRHFADFVQIFWDIVIAEPMVWEDHLDVVCSEVEEVYRRVFMRYEYDESGRRVAVGRLAKEYDLVINIPPGMTKSTIVSQLAPAWGWANDPTLRYINGSYAKSLSLSNAMKTRDVVTSDRYRAFYPYVQIRDDSSAIGDYKTTRGGQRYAASVGSAVTGVHAHIITIDDPLDPMQANSLADVEAANTWMDGTVSQRKSDRKVTPTIVLMQRVHEEDPSGKLLEKRKEGLPVRHVCLPGILDDNVSPVELRRIYKNNLLSEKRLGLEALKDAKIRLGTARFSAQIQQRPAPKGGLIWKRWFIPIPDDVFPSPATLRRYGTDWDLAYTKDDENAATAYVTAGVINRRIYIDDIGWDWKEFPDMIHYMKTRPAPHYIEAKASGKSAKQSLSTAGIAAIEVPVKGGDDKIARANMATPTAEAGLVCVRASILERLYTDSKQGILFFPKGKYKDLSDVLAQCLQRLAPGGTIVVAGSEDLEDDEDLNDL